jgi:hypothetical protein
MKVGGGIGASGALYKRHSQTTYTPGSKYQRFGRFGLINQRNMSTMNRRALTSYNDSFSIAGFNAFALKALHSEGLSEIAANKVLQRVKQAMTTLADSASSFSTANGGSGGTTGSNVDTTA